MVRDNHNNKDNEKGKGKMTVKKLDEKVERQSEISMVKSFTKRLVKKGGEKVGNAVVEKYGPEHMAEIGRKGGEAPHDERGLQAADEQTKERVARQGGEAPHEQRGRGEDNDNPRNSKDDDNNNERGSDRRGFASMSEDKRKEIDKKGGESSHSGGRKD